MDKKKFLFLGLALILASLFVSCSKEEQPVVVEEVTEEEIERYGVVAIELAQLTAQDVFQQHMILAAALLFAVLRRYVCVSHGLQKHNSRLLTCVNFRVYIFIHGTASFQKRV